MMFPEFSSLARVTFVACTVLNAGVILPGSAIAAESTQAAGALSVTIDRAKVVRIAKAADTIIIGNPGVVDATIQDARTIVLTGRNFGTTNLIVLDADGDAIVDETIVVKGNEQNLVRVYRQSEKETLTCSPVCENTLAVGDELRQFKTVEDQMDARNNLAQKYAGDR